MASSNAGKGEKQTQPAVVGELINETGFYQSIRLSKNTAGDKETTAAPLLRKQSSYQLIEVYQTSYYGKVLALDGILQ